MKKSDLKKIIKPLVKECIHEVLIEEGVLSNIVSEVAVGMRTDMLTEDRRPQPPPVKQRQNTLPNKQKANETKRKLMEAINKDAYTLSDRATWESFSNKAEHRVLVSNKSILLNYYGVIPISKQKCPNAKLGLAKVFIEWLVSNKTKLIINNFRINNKQLFFSLDESN